MGAVSSSFDDLQEEFGCTAKRKPDKPQGYVQVVKPTPVESVDDVFQKAIDQYDNWKPAVPLSRNEKHMIYALMMQATHGDVCFKKPPAYQPEARAKWFAWAQLEGDMSIDRAKTGYIEEVGRLMRTHGRR